MYVVGYLLTQINGSALQMIDMSQGTSSFFVFRMLKIWAPRLFPDRKFPDSTTFLAIAMYVQFSRPTFPTS
jgi:hypothetical protein